MFKEKLSKSEESELYVSSIGALPPLPGGVLPIGIVISPETLYNLPIIGSLVKEYKIGSIKIIEKALGEDKWSLHIDVELSRFSSIELSSKYWRDRILKIIKKYTEFFDYKFVLYFDNGGISVKIKEGVRTPSTGA